MKINFKRWLDKHDTYNRDWHWWFAWYPIEIDGYIVWLQIVLRAQDQSWVHRYNYRWCYRFKSKLS